MKWDSELGVWHLIQTKWLTLTGSTPRNADVWTANVELGPLDLELWLGLRKYTHSGIGLDWKFKSLIYWDFKAKTCNCYGCETRKPMSAATAAAINAAMSNPNRFVRKLPPRP